MSRPLDGPTPYDENHEDGTYTFHVRCTCGSVTDSTVPGAGLFAYRQGKNIQAAFPDLSVVERETLISGMCPKCQAMFFGVPA